MSREYAPLSEDPADNPYAGLDSDERAEAMSSGIVAGQTSTQGRWFSGAIPLQPGIELTRRSLWTGVAVVVLGFAVFGALVQGIAGIAIAGVVLSTAMVFHGRGAARRIVMRGPADLVIEGGLWGRTVELTDFAWAGIYRAPFGWPSVRPSTTVVLHGQAGRHWAAKIIAVCFPMVSRRRTTISLSSMWRLPATGQRVPDDAMAEFLRRACRDAGLEVQTPD